MKLPKDKVEFLLIGLSLSVLIVGAGVLYNSTLKPVGVKEPIVTEKAINPTPPMIKKIKKSPQRTVAQHKIQSQTKKPNPIQNSHKNMTNKSLSSLERCYDVEGLCGFPTDDPKSEHFAIGQEIKRQLLALEDEASQNNKKNEDLAAIARKFLKIPDGHVKSAALHLLSSQETSHDNLQAILEEIISYHDANLIAHAMLELGRYKGQGYDEKIDTALINALKHGSPLVSEEIGKHLAPFINKSNFKAYRNALAQLNLGTVAYQNLKNVLDDYIRQKNAA